MMSHPAFGYALASIRSAALIGLLLVRPAAAAEPSEVVRATLANGMRVIVVPDRLAPVVATSLNHLVGSTDSPPGFPGTAHALEHMMFRGAEGLDRDQLSELGGLLGGAYNASTAETLTQYTYTIPASDLGLVLRIEAGRMRGLTLSEVDWTQERGAIEQEVSRNLSNPIYNATAAVQAALFADTPYSHDALGTRPSFDKTDAAALRRFYDDWYAPNNAILVIAGDVDPQAVLLMVRQAFDAIPSRPIPAHAALPALSPIGSVAPIDIPTNLPYVAAGLAFRMPGLRASDFATADILADVLATRRGALYALVPAGRVLGAQFQYQAKADVGLGLAFVTLPSGSDPAPALADLRRVLADAAGGAIPTELVEAAKRQERAQLAFEADSISGLARAWSRAVAVAGLESPGDLAQAYADVTPDAVRQLARRLLDPSQAVTMVLTPRTANAPASPARFGVPETPGAVPESAVTLPDWAAAALAAAPSVDSATPPVVSTLPNGVRLIVKSEAVSPTVSMFARVREVSDTQQPPGQDGVAALVSRLFDEGSLTRGRLAREEAMDDIGAQHSVGFGFSLRALKGQFEAGMRLLADAELHPAFPQGPFEVSRRQLAQSLAKLPETPDFRASEALETALVPAGDPALRQATPETVMALTLADVRAYYDAAFRPDQATIVVVGDVTPEEARRIVESTFGSWRATGPTPAIDLPPIGINPPSETRITDAGRLQDAVTLAETVTLPVTHPDRYALILGNGIMGGDFSSRLYRDLRIRTGYVYSVGSSFDWSRTRGRYTVSFGADGADVPKAEALVRRNLVAMQTSPVSASELARAKAQVLRRLTMQGASVGGIASSYLRLAELGLPLDSQERAAGLYEALSAEDIRRAFATWVRPDGLVQVVKGPPL